MSCKVYAGFTGQLNISSGNVVGRKSNWDIHFENVSNITTTGTAKVLNNHEPTINSNNPHQIDDYDVSLTSPNDSISFTFDIVNSGNYNAKITSIDIDTPECSSIDQASATNMCNNLTYTLTDINGASISVNDIVYAKDKLSLKVTLTFNDISDASLLPTEDVSISNLGIEIDFVQEGNALVKDNDEVANYRVYHQGDKITLNNEDYYVIANSGAGDDYVTALKLNILTNMAFSIDNSTNEYDLSSVKDYVDNWAATTFINDELKEVNGYSARLLTKDEADILSGHSFTWFVGNNRYWTMTPYIYNNIYLVSGDSIVYVGRSASSVNVRPVINVYKSALETNNNNK